MPHEKISFRPATVEDCAVIWALLAELAEWLGTPERLTSTPESLARDGFGEDRQFTVLLAEAAGEVSGLCLYFPLYSTWAAAKGFYVQDLVVLSKYRGAGIGEALLRETARQGLERGYRFMRLAVDSCNPSAARFYQRLGFISAADEVSHKLMDEAFSTFAQGAVRHQLF